MKTRLKGLLGIWLAVIMMVGMVIPAAAADNTPKIRFVNSSNPYSADVEISADGGTTWRKPTDSDNVSYQWYETEEIAWSYMDYLSVSTSGEYGVEASRSYSNHTLDSGTPTFTFAQGYPDASAIVKAILNPGETVTLTPSSHVTDFAATFYLTANWSAIEDIIRNEYPNSTDTVNVYHPVPSNGSYSFTNHTESTLYCVLKVSGTQGLSSDNHFFSMTGTKAVLKTGWTSNSLLDYIDDLTPNESYSCKATYGDSSAFGAPVNYQKPTITINYGEGGGSTTYNGILTEAPDAKPVEGKLFAGWYTDAALTKPYDFSNPITSSISLYAKYVSPVKRSRVSFVADGRLVAIVLYKPSQDELTFIPKVPKKEGYVGAWEAYTLNGKDMLVRAVYTQE